MVIPLTGEMWLSLYCREKPLNVETRVSVPQTDSGGRAEYAKVIGRTLVKELGNIDP
jgi:hypothetical protein